MEPLARLRFGVFEADLGAGELSKLGRLVRLQEQPFQLLSILLRRPGELVTREELQAGLWPQTTVDYDHGLNKAVAKIRKALGDSAENPRFVETVAHRGYRFLADVAIVNDGRSETALEVPAKRERPCASSASLAPPNKASGVFGWKLVGLGFALILAASLSWLVYRSNYSLTAIRSLAVLPLENLSNDPSQNFFADGMTDELITHLGQISALRVISRTSGMAYKDTHKPIADIARALDVQAVVIGSVLLVGDRVRITTQLIRVPEDSHIWAESYEGDVRDTLALQSNVAQAIVRQIRIRLTQEERTALQKSRKIVPEAYENYLKGRYFWEKRTSDGLRKAIQYFTDSLQADPGYAEAYSGLADAYSLAGDWKYAVVPAQEAFPKARAAALQALALDDKLSQAHSSLALVLDLYDWDWKRAENEYRQALHLNPGYATAHHWYAWHLMVTGKTNR